MDNTQFNRMVTILGLIGTAIGFFWSVSQWSEANRRAEETRLLEAKSPFLEQQLKTYTQLVELASTLANTESNSHEIDAAKKKFLQYYAGKAILVQNSEVARAMTAMKTSLDTTQLERFCASIELAKAVAKSLNDSWNIREWSDLEVACQPDFSKTLTRGIAIQNR